MPNHDPDLEAWLDEQERLRDRDFPRCGSCGTELLTMLRSEKPKCRWWVCHEVTCGHAWEMKRGQMVRKPASDSPVCTDKECCP